MSQFFKAAVISEDGKMCEISPADYKELFGLMQHSWVGSSFVNAVLNKCYGEPHRVAWVGDYSDWEGTFPENGLGQGYVKDRSNFVEEYYHDMWGDGSCNREKPDPLRFDVDASDIFVVNLTKKCFIDMEKYVKDHKPVGKYEKCTNPIPILTSVGNGNGTDDYDGPNQEHVGTWAFDEIYVTALRPANLKEVKYSFENDEFLPF